MQLLCAGTSQLAQPHHIRLLVEEVQPKFGDLANLKDLVAADIVPRDHARIKLFDIKEDDLALVEARDQVAVLTEVLHYLKIRLERRSRL